MTRILVVEDDPAIALGLRNDLTLEGYSTRCLGMTKPHPSRSRNQRFDLILLDVMLPRKYGFGVARDPRRVGLKTPIIFLTARAREVAKDRGVRADDYVTQPFGSMDFVPGPKLCCGETAGEQALLYRHVDADSVPRSVHGPDAAARGQLGA